MTQTEFHEALLKGQGRCIQAVKADPERYRAEVLWACSHAISYDPQCEGSRAAYVYELIRCYADPRPFVTAAAQALGEAPLDGSWEILYLGEMLYQLADDGHREAEAALWDKYQVLYRFLLENRRPSEGIFPERDNFEELALVLAEKPQWLPRVARDIGRLYETGDYDAWDFAWLYSDRSDYRLELLQDLAGTDAAIARFLEAKQELDRPMQEPQHVPYRQRPPEEILELAQHYLSLTDPEERYEALFPFFLVPYPLDPETLFPDALGDHEDLSYRAWMVLGRLRHPKVRAFGLAHLDREEALELIMANYEEGDEELLTRYVRAIPTDWETTTNWHGAHLAVLNMDERAPTALLHHIFETSYCACCRYNAVKELKARGLLTPEERSECCYDSYDDVRELVSEK